MLLVHGRYVCQQALQFDNADTPSLIGREEDSVLSSDYPRSGILSYHYPLSFLRMAGSSLPCFMTGYVLLLAFWHPQDRFTTINWVVKRLGDQASGA